MNGGDGFLGTHVFGDELRDPDAQDVSVPRRNFDAGNEFQSMEMVVFPAELKLPGALPAGQGVMVGDGQQIQTSTGGHVIQ